MKTYLYRASNLKSTIIFTHIYSPLATPINLTNLSYFQYDDVCNSHTYTKLYRHWNDEYNVTSIKNKTKQLN